MRSLSKPDQQRAGVIALSLVLAATLLMALLAPMIATAPTARAAAPAPQTAQSTPTGRSDLFTRGSDLTEARLGPTDPARPLSLSVSMVTPSEAEVNRALAAINDPHSPQYHHYLTPAEYASRFGASPAAQAKVMGTLRAAGFIVTPPPIGASLITATGTVGQAQELFDVRLSDFRTADGRVYYAPDRAPRLPASWTGAALGVLGLNNRPTLHPAGIRRMTLPGAQPPPRLLGPTELERAYNIAPLKLEGLNGEGQTIALPEIDTFKSFDIAYYDRTYGLNTPRIDIVQVNGGADKAQEVSEATLDIEVIHAVAPATKIIVYESPADYTSLANNFSRIVTDNRAKTVSVSLGGCEPAIWDAKDLGPSYFATLNNIFRQGATQGMTFFVSSGDDGAYTCHRNDPSDDTLSASLPSTSPFVTAVGGTALYINNDGSYFGEAGWEGPLSGSGSGGGLSVGYPRPDWQTGPGVSNTYSSDMRQVPDVAASADPLTGYRIYDSTGVVCSGEDCWAAVGGTSASSPLWASIIVLANQQAAKSSKPTMGFINPALYQMGADASLKAAFHDVTVGGNLYYIAGSGWDYATGWGTPDAAKLVAELLTLRSAG